MSIDDQLHLASRDMERVMAALTPPPIAEVRRSVRSRVVGVAAAAAVGVAVLVGGVVFALGSGGDTTLAPAAPGETTIPQRYPAEVDGIPVRVPNPDAEPDWDIYADATAVPFAVPVTTESDIRQALGAVAGDLNGVTHEVLVLGRSETYRSYLLLGEFTARNPKDGGSAIYAMCVVLLADTGDRQGCFADDAGVETVIDLEPQGGSAVFGVAGLSAPGSSAVVLDIDGSKTWARTREGTVNIVGRGTVESAVEYTIYDAAGNPMGSSEIWSPERAEDLGGSKPITTVQAVEVGASCSGEEITPAALALSSIPQPVAQVIAGIVEAARTCDFDALESVAGGGFTASFGGGDASEMWAMQEQRGDQPMQVLLEILDMPHGTINTENGTLYVWPSAYAHQGDWSTVPAEDVEALRSFYTEEEIQGFAEFGGYYGYRVGIWDTGDWSFFVTGD